MEGQAKESNILISSMSSAETVAIHRRHSSQPIVDKPVVAHQYNHNMNGVDKADQNSVYNHFTCRSAKWWRKLFFWLLEVSIVNSYLLFKQLSPTTVPHLHFRRKVVEGLMEGLPLGLQRQKAIQAPPPHQRFQGRNYLEKGQSRCLCIVCSNMSRGERHDTVFYYKTCIDYPPMQPTPCFKRYHELQNYAVRY